MYICFSRTMIEAYFHISQDSDDKGDKKEDSVHDNTIFFLSLGFFTRLCL